MEIQGKLTAISAVAFDSVAEECNLLCASVLIQENAPAKQITSHSGMYLVDFCGVFAGLKFLLVNKCLHIQTLKGLEKSTLKKKRG